MYVIHTLKRNPPYVRSLNSLRSPASVLADEINTLTPWVAKVESPNAYNTEPAMAGEIGKRTLLEAVQETDMARKLFSETSLEISTEKSLILDTTDITDETCEKPKDKAVIHTCLRKMAYHVRESYCL
ncbi:hypothetical protein K469DRAFT_686946 [Zopfia rhizophila CBS 207.26]|uniref:Uncharacterized protein n=1 Tax=Zopfia rhizophila CBS 207.26 TaxID=1314779 RepID=A0A6A6E3Q4_9PEZI|nr:hypothetical protein K469DRAFT_686946 [Zopfia rhizophila CBS 207.26]